MMDSVRYVVSAGRAVRLMGDYGCHAVGCFALLGGWIWAHSLLYRRCPRFFCGFLIKIY